MVRRFGSIMIVQSIIDKIKTNLDELGLSYFSEEDILQVIQDGYDEIATLTGCIEKSTTYPMINDLIYYDFSVGIADFYAVVGIWNNNTKRWLSPRTLKEAQLIRSDWELMDGEPDNFIVSSFKLVGVFPTNAIVTGSFIIFYNALAETLTMTSTPTIPPKHFNILEEYAMASLLEQSQEFVKAQTYLKSYLNAIPKVRNAAKTLAAMNRLMIIGDSMPMFAESLLSGETEMWVDFETPTVINTSTLTIAGTPSPPSAFYLYRDGMLLFSGIGFTRSGTTITLSPGYEHVLGANPTVWRCSYRVA